MTTPESADKSAILVFISDFGRNTRMQRKTPPLSPG